MVRLYCILIGYLFGLFQTAYIYGKLNGIDIRTVGSGNAGTTNALRVLGKKAGFIVFFGDVLKTILAIVVVRLLFGAANPDLVYLLSLYTAAGAILGHNFPFYMGFKGGKGIAATAGLIAAFHPYFIVVELSVFLIIFFTTHYVSLGSLLVYVAFMSQLVISGQMGLFGAMSQNALFELYGVGAFLTVMAFVRHRQNIKKLMTGTERKTYLTKKSEQ